MWLIIVIYVFRFCSSANLPLSGIYRFMDVHELQYYFGTTAEHIPDYEIINVLKESPDRKMQHLLYEDNEKTSFRMSLKIVDQPYSFDMKLNDHLVAPQMKFVIKTINGTQQQLDHAAVDNCHFIYSDGENSAAVSNCHASDMVCIQWA